MSTKTLCKITKFLRKKLLFRPWNSINLGIYSFSKAYPNLLVIHISRLLTRNTLLPIQMLSNYLMNVYPFEDILAKLQRTLIENKQTGNFYVFIEHITYGFVFCHQSIMASLELCLNLKIFHVLETALINILKSLIKEKLYHRKHTTHYLYFKIKSWDQFTHISDICFFMRIQCQ